MYKRKLKKMRAKWACSFPFTQPKKFKFCFFSLLLGSGKKKEKEMFGSCITTEAMKVAAAY